MNSKSLIFDSILIFYFVIRSTNARVSDWCFTGPLDSTPPYGKSTEVYDFVRWLGRGSFGEVSLIKSKEDNNL